jgi:hypothetical protein
MELHAGCGGCLPMSLTMVMMEYPTERCRDQPEAAKSLHELGAPETYKVFLYYRFHARFLR